MSRKDRLQRICRVLLVMNLCFIWGNSLLPGELSGAFSDWVKQLLASIFPGDGMETAGSGLLRKAAHFTEFAALGFLLSLHFRLQQKTIRNALLWGILAAGIDETIQMFVPDRGPGLLDVAIDTCGVMAGMVLLQIGYLIINKKTTNHYGGKQ